MTKNDVKKRGGNQLKLNLNIMENDNIVFD